MAHYGWPVAHHSPPLTPVPFLRLLGRISHEWNSRQRIFDLPKGRFWTPDPDIDLGFEFLGRRCATPLGPAAGPHSQLAQNVVLAWLGGSRLFELKTVQVLDDLEIARPCIDVSTVGYNIEWSQELSIDDSLSEYAKAWVLVHLLEGWEPLQALLGPHPGPFVFDMSVGYDLPGIQSEKVARFLTGMNNASGLIDGFCEQISSGPNTEFAALAAVDIPSTIADTVTLSTFHGCPPEDIEDIVHHLTDEHDLDIVVKLNPTLLGFDTVNNTLRHTLGHDDVTLSRQAFDADVQFDDGIALIQRLSERARIRGRKFGIKLTNTLVVDNQRGVLPEETMYLSGPPLHVLAMTLLERLNESLPGQLDLPDAGGEIMVSFSAGISKENIADSLATGVNPVTVSTDLLKPGGYGRLAPMLKSLTSTLRDEGHQTLDEFRASRLLAAQDEGFQSALSQHCQRILGPGATMYSNNVNAKERRQVDHELQMFGCVACNLCVTVCPNDAFTSIKSNDLGIAALADRQQYLVFAELCNECGNCLTFCPETGDPAEIKPRLFLDPTVFDSRNGQGFLIANGDVVRARGSDEEINHVRTLLQRDVGDPTGPAVPRD